MFRYILFLLIGGLFSFASIKFDITLTPSSNLYPVDSFTKKDNSRNVLQGVASYGDKWLVSQAVGKNRLLFNLLNKSGFPIANRQLNYPSHGQDISIEEINASAFYLYTVGKHNRGIAKFLVSRSRENKKLNIKLVKELNSKKHNSTVALSRDKRHLLSYSKGKITIYDKNSLKEIRSFFVLKEQRKTWFQGLSMYKNHIFTLSGKNRIRDKKILAIYNRRGECILKFHIKAKCINPSLYFKKGKWELEGLAFKGRELFTTINSYIDGKKRKQLLKILKVEK